MPVGYNPLETTESSGGQKMLTQFLNDRDFSEAAAINYLSQQQEILR